MSLNSRAKQLAVILLKSAQNSGNAHEVQLSLRKIVALLNKDVQFRTLLLSKRIATEKKVNILRNVLADYAHQLVIEFLGIISKEFSNDLFRRVVKVYNELYKKEEGVVFVSAHLSHTLDDSKIDNLRTNLESALNKKADLNVEVNHELLGGIKLRIENTFLDASLQNQMIRLREKLLQS